MAHWTHVLIAFVNYSGLVVLIGTLAMRNLLTCEAFAATQAYSIIITRRLNAILIIALLALTLSLPSVLLIRATMMSARPISDVMPVLPTLLTNTHYGTIWLIRCALLLSLWVLTLPLIKTNRSWPQLLMFIVAVFTAWTISAVGHAGGWSDFSWQQLVDWLHIVCASLWGGSMLSTLFVVWPLLNADADTGQDFISTACLRLSRLAERVFLLVIATGLVNLYLQLSSPSDLLTTDYGRILTGKMSLVLMMLGFAFINRNLFLPQASATGSRSSGLSKLATLMAFIFPGLKKQTKKIAARHFFQLLILETLCMFAVLLGVAILRHGPPPPHMMM